MELTTPLCNSRDDLYCSHIILSKSYIGPCYQQFLRKHSSWICFQGFIYGDAIAYKLKLLNQLKSSLVLGMNPQLEKRENSYASNEEVMHSPSFESLRSGLPFPDFVNNYHYASNGGAVLQQSHHSHYQSSLSELFNGSTQLPQSWHHQGLDHQAIYGKMTDFNYESSRKSHAASSIRFPADYQAQHGDRLGILHSKITNLVPAHRGTSAGGNSYSSWRQGEFKHGDMFCSSNSHIGTTAVYSSMQSGGAATGKQRIRWTQELHEQFVEAVNHLGGAMKATPKGILALMKSRGLTIFHIKSHLQKYRTAKCMPNFLEGKNGKTINNVGMPISNFGRYGGLQIYETLRLQMDIQKSLCEHLEFQKKLQMRIEEHANCLERMFDQQQRSCSFFKNDNSTKAMTQSIAECSSIGEYENNTEVIPTKQEPQASAFEIGLK